MSLRAYEHMMMMMVISSHINVAGVLIERIASLKHASEESMRAFSTSIEISPI